MVGDFFSVMKVIISKPGIKIENINIDSFYGLTNVNKNQIGTNSLWNGMMLIGNKLFAVSSDYNLLDLNKKVIQNIIYYNHLK